MLPSAKRAIGRIKISKAFIILWSIFLIGFGASFFYFKGRAKKLTTVNASADDTTPTSVKDTLIMPVPGATQVADASKEKSNPDKKLVKTEATPKRVEAPKEKTVATIKNTGATIQTDIASVPSKGKYKILSKAYFHNEPDESSRRNAFVNHWNNSYATLNALDEKNDFIYVVFRNHLNQTSKGWLRKKDLRPATEQELASISQKEKR
jgi:hypothetical protein